MQQYRTPHEWQKRTIATLHEIGLGVFMPIIEERRVVSDGQQHFGQSQDRLV